ncbi:hypothetical protein ACLOJK_009817 [Asimina triloba]
MFHSYGTFAHVERHRRLYKAAIPSSRALSLLGRDLQEAHFQVLLGGGGYRSSNMNSSNATSDSLLSQRILNFPQFEVEEILKYTVPDTDDVLANVVETPCIWKSRDKATIPLGETDTDDNLVA